ncbi:hypothetical protein ANN_13941 [Periplaneta americana]|uniref:DUF4817 domain-containing protein n=1 Tax=Periplaneta americana TaxID=6978 RepID=A0ABQ8SWG4_PERAM|nr:hypothetical protein ANN_13941 [Periplaneta americana]
MYGKADGNAALARRLYQERYPQRQCPDRKTFICTSPLPSVLLKEYQLYPYHLQRVQALSPADYPARVRFCQWFLQQCGTYGAGVHKLPGKHHTVPHVLEDTPLINRQHIHFLHDGPPAHFSRTARRYLDRRFPDRWIGRGGPIAWPPRSPDLNRLDFYLWGHLKSLVYSSPVPDLESLQNRIAACSEDIRNTPGVWDRVRRSMRHRCEVWLAFVMCFAYVKVFCNFVMAPHYTTQTHPHRKQNKRRQDQQQPVLKMANSRPKHVNKYLQEIGIRSLDWPARSPDINSTEYVWECSEGMSSGVTSTLRVVEGNIAGGVGSQPPRCPPTQASQSCVAVKPASRPEFDLSVSAAVRASEALSLSAVDRSWGT